jgi:hypothetical protein
MRSPDRHKLRGRLHGVQDRLGRLEVKMVQAGSMLEPCMCVPSPPCTCQAVAKRNALVDRMQVEIEALQAELYELRDVLPGAFA